MTEGQFGRLQIGQLELCYDMVNPKLFIFLCVFVDCRVAVDHLNLVLKDTGQPTTPTHDWQTLVMHTELFLTNYINN